MLLSSHEELSVTKKMDAAIFLFSCLIFQLKSEV